MERVQETQELVLALVCGLPAWMPCRRSSRECGISHLNYSPNCGDFLGGSVGVCRLEGANVALSAVRQAFFPGPLGKFLRKAMRLLRLTQI